MFSKWFRPKKGCASRWSDFSILPKKGFNSGGHPIAFWGATNLEYRLPKRHTALYKMGPLLITKWSYGAPISRVINLLITGVWAHFVFLKYSRTSSTISTFFSELCSSPKKAIILEHQGVFWHKHQFWTQLCTERKFSDPNRCDDRPGGKLCESHVNEWDLRLAWIFLFGPKWWCISWWWIPLAKNPYKINLNQNPSVLVVKFHPANKLCTP